MFFFNLGTNYFFLRLCENRIFYLDFRSFGFFSLRGYLGDLVRIVIGDCGEKDNWNKCVGGVWECVL